MNITLDHIEVEAPHISTFYFKPERAFAYQPGQYIELTLPHADVDNRGDRRPFALSSSPTEALISITNKFAARDGSSFKRALASLRPGDQLRLSGPKGRFVLPADPSTPLVFVAGGIGITPFRSMARWLTDRQEIRPVRLFYGVSHERDAMFLPELHRAISDVTIMASNPSSEWRGQRGYLTADVIMREARLAANALFYISGPEGLVKTLQAELLAAGVRQTQLVVDLFTGYHAA